MRVELDYANGKMEGAVAFIVECGRTGARLPGVVEASPKEGWYRQIVFDGHGRAVRGPDNKPVIRRVDAPVKVYRWETDAEVVNERQRRAEQKRARQAERQAKAMKAA